MSALSLADLRQFTGGGDCYQHELNSRVIYTEGVRYLAEHGGAYWLIDAIASYYGSPQMRRAIASDPRLETLQFWTLTVHDTAAQLVARADSGNEPFILQDVPFTDFPLERVDVWAGFDGQRWTLYLPSEH